MNSDVRREKSRKVTEIHDGQVETVMHPAIKLNEMDLPVHTRQIALALRSRVQIPALIAHRVLQWLETVNRDGAYIFANLNETLDSFDVVAASAALRSVHYCSFPLEPDSLIRLVCAAGQDSCRSVSGRVEQMDLPWAAELAPSQRIMNCIAMPEIDERLVLISFLSVGHAEQAVNAISALRGMLRTFAAGPRADVSDAETLAKIVRAKDEWERTVDSLNDVVLVLDRKGEVLRANKAIERWNLGRVDAVRGADLHSVLHVNCTNPECRFRRIIDCRWKEFRTKDEVRFDIDDALNEKSFHVTLRSVTDGESNAEQAAAAVAVFSDISELVRTKRRLEETNDSLEDRVAERTEQLREKNAALRSEILRREAADREVSRSHDELARLTEQLIHSQEAERQRLSLEIHDGLGQTLGALKYVIENAIELLNRGDNDIALEGLSRGVTEIQVAIDDARSMATNLRPTLLDDLGPVAAIRWLCGRFAENYGSIEIILECDLPAEDFPPAIALHVFRIVQEALNNVAKHAQAQTVLVAIRKNRGAIQLIVRDDGSGFDPGLEIQNRHIGIAGMRHRARISGGEFLLTSNPESGTQISVAWGPAEDLN